MIITSLTGTLNIQPLKESRCVVDPHLLKQMHTPFNKSKGQMLHLGQSKSRYQSRLRDERAALLRRTRGCWCVTERVDMWT